MIERKFYATLMRSGSGFYIYVPKRIAKGGGIKDRDEVEVIMARTGVIIEKSKKAVAAINKRVVESSTRIAKEKKEEDERIEKITKEAELANMSTAEKAIKGYIEWDAKSQ